MNPLQFRSYTRAMIFAAVIVSAATAFPRTARAEKTFLGAILEAFGVKSQPPPRARAMEAAVAVPDPNHVNKFSPTLKKVLNAEIYFARKVCEPTQAQFDQLLEAGGKDIQEIAGELAKLQEHSSDWPDVRKLLTDRLCTHVDKIFPAEIAKRYRAEIQARQQARRAAAIHMMIADVDQEVVLTRDQSEKLKEIIEKAWLPEWGRNLRVYTYFRFAPAPDLEVAAPILKPQQRELWTRSPSNRIHFGWESEMGFNGELRGAELPDVTKLPNRKPDQPAEEKQKTEE